MNDCKWCQERQLDFFYGDLEAREESEFRSHMADCDDCERSYREVEETLTAMTPVNRAEPDEAVWTNCWPAVVEKIEDWEQTRKRSWWQVFGVRSWGFQGAVALLLLLIGLAAGHYGLFSPLSTEDLTTASLERHSSEELLARVDRHLDRSKALILGIVHLEPEGDSLDQVELEFERELSRELAEEAGLLQVELAAAGADGVAELIADLELTLHQIANLSQADDSSLDFIKMAVDHRALLFRINLSEMLRRPATPPSNT